MDTVNWLTDIVFLEGQGMKSIVCEFYSHDEIYWSLYRFDRWNVQSGWCFIIFIEWERFLVGYTGAPDCSAQHITLSSNHLYKGMSRWIGNGKWNKNSCRSCCNMLTITQSLSARSLLAIYLTSRVNTRIWWQLYSQEFKKWLEYTSGYLPLRKRPLTSTYFRLLTSPSR